VANWCFGAFQIMVEASLTLIHSMLNGLLATTFGVGQSAREWSKGEGKRAGSERIRAFGVERYSRSGALLIERTLDANSRLIQNVRINHRRAHILVA
jgi:hypothetical protein